MKFRNKNIIKNIFILILLLDVRPKYCIILNVKFGFSGRGSGSFGGGLLIASLGTREAFRYMGLIAFLGGVLYGLLHYFWLRKISMSDMDFNNCTEQYAGMISIKSIDKITL